VFGSFSFAETSGTDSRMELTRPDGHHVAVVGMVMV
jgi:hypothetical protein